MITMILYIFAYIFGAMVIYSLIYLFFLFIWMIIRLFIDAIKFLKNGGSNDYPF